MNTKIEKRTKTAFDVPVQRFVDNVDTQKLADFIANDPDLEAFSRALSDPEYSQMTFPSLCRKFHVSLSKLQTIYTDGMRHLGLLAMSTQLPQVMFDVAEDAKSRMVTCSRCDGTGHLRGRVENEEERICPTCEGKTKVKVMGDKHARDLVFESMKLTAQSGPMVAIQQNFSGGDESMENLFKTSQMITVGKKEESEE